MINAYPIADPHVRDSIPETLPHQVGPTTTPKMTTSTHDKPVDSWDTPDAMLQNKIINAWVSMRETPLSLLLRDPPGLCRCRTKKVSHQISWTSQAKFGPSRQKYTKREETRFRVIEQESKKKKDLPAE